MSRRQQDEILPGMPDKVDGAPPKATEYEALTLDEAIARAHRILDGVLDGVTIRTDKVDDESGRVLSSSKQKLAAPEKAFLLFSGGGDSSILAHLFRDRVDGFVHVRTGISIEACWTYVQAACAEWGVPLHPAYPDDSYEDLVMGRVGPKTDKGKRAKGEPFWTGFPGPAAHAFFYQRLKERALEKFRSSVVGRRGRTAQIAFVAGMRWAESDRRYRNASEWDLWGSVIWCSPIVWLTQGHMTEYRDRHMCNEAHSHAPHRLCFPGALPLSEVSEHLHRSGDCDCGSYAHEGELDEIEFFYPEEAARIRALMDAARAAGIKRCVWGAGKQPGDGPASVPGRLCSNCAPPLAGQLDITDQWLARGLISADEHAALASRGAS